MRADAKKNLFSAFLILSLVISTLTILLAVSAQQYSPDSGSGRITSFKQCLGTPSGDCKAAISKCLGADQNQKEKVIRTDFEACKEANGLGTIKFTDASWKKCMTPVIEWMLGVNYPSQYIEEIAGQNYLTSEGEQASEDEVNKVSDEFLANCNSAQASGAEQAQPTPYQEPIQQAEEYPVKISKEVSASPVSDLSADPLYKSIMAFQSKGSLTAEEVASAMKSFRAKISANKGESVKVKVPEIAGILLEEVVVTPARQLADADTTITFIAPVLGGSGIFGNPDYPLPDAPASPPSENKYTVMEYFKVHSSEGTEYEASLPFYEKAWFKFSVSSAVESAKNTILLRYSEETNKWNPLPTQRILSVGETSIHQFISESPGTSYFAIVIEKKSPYGALFWWTFIIVAWLAALFSYLKIKKQEEYKDLISSKSISGKVKVLGDLKFKELAFGKGVLYFAYILTAALIVAGFIEGSLKFSPFTDFIIIILVYFIASLITGFIFGLITWILLKILSKIFKV